MLKTLFVLLIPAAIFAEEKAILLTKSTGDIFKANICSSGLIIQKELSAEITDASIPGFTGALGIIPPCASNQRLAFSDNGEFVLRLTFSGRGDYVTAEKTEMFQVKDGRLVFTLDNPGFSEAVVSDKGGIIGIDRNINYAEKSSLAIFDAMGKLINRTACKAVTQIKFTNEGEYFGVISGADGLIIYTQKGEIAANLGHCQWFDIIQTDADVICAYTIGNTIGYFSLNHAKNRWQREIGKEVFRDIAIDVNTGITAAVSKQNFYCLSAEKGEILWSNKANSPTSFTTCAVGNNCLAFGWEIDSGRTADFQSRHVQGGYTLIKGLKDKNFIQFSEDLNYSSWNVFTPDVKFYQNGLLIQTMDEIRFLKID